MEGEEDPELAQALALSLEGLDVGDSAQDKSYESIDADYALALDLQKKEEAAAAKSEGGGGGGDGPSNAGEDKDYAYALQLSREEEKRSGVREESGRSPSRVSYAKHATPSSSSSSSMSMSKPWDHVDVSLCPVCREGFGGVVAMGMGMGARSAHVNALGRKFHLDCFRCTGCQEVVKGRFQHRAQEIYCVDCAQTLFAPRCYLCNDQLSGRLHKHPFFDTMELGHAGSRAQSQSQSPSQDTGGGDSIGGGPAVRGYCPSHEETQKPCFGCHRREPVAGRGREPFTHLPDGRVLCEDCICTVVLDSDTARGIYLETVTFIEHVLRLPVPPDMRNIPILAVDTAAMGEHRAGAAKDHHARKASVPQGLTLKTLTQVRHYGGAPRQQQSGRGVLDFLLPPPQVCTVDVQREVTAVLVLTGMPRIQMAGVLAHEAFHVWCSLTRSMPNRLPLKVEEGLCQLVSSRYFAERLAGYTTQPTMQTEWDYLLVRFLQHSIEVNPDPVYGEGFREAATSANAVGLEILLEHVAQTSNFPVLN